jgi:regulator of replication initiation timing
MNETKAQSELTGLERFAHLEDKIFRLVEEFKAVRKDNDTLRAENTQLKDQLAAMQNVESTAKYDLAKYQKEREELRVRVERALDLLSDLDGN